MRLYSLWITGSSTRTPARLARCNSSSSAANQGSFRTIPDSGRFSGSRSTRPGSNVTWYAAPCAALSLEFGRPVRRHAYRGAPSDEDPPSSAASDPSTASTSKESPKLSANARTTAPPACCAAQRASAISARVGTSAAPPLVPFQTSPTSLADSPQYSSQASAAMSRAHDTRVSTPVAFVGKSPAQSTETRAMCGTLKETKRRSDGSDAPPGPSTRSRRPARRTKSPGAIPRLSHGRRNPSARGAPKPGDESGNASRRLDGPASLASAPTPRGTRRGGPAPTSSPVVAGTTRRRNTTRRTGDHLPDAAPGRTNPRRVERAPPRDTPIRGDDADGRAMHHPAPPPRGTYGRPDPGRLSGPKSENARGPCRRRVRVRVRPLDLSRRLGPTETGAPRRISGVSRLVARFSRRRSQMLSPAARPALRAARGAFAASRRGFVAADAGPDPASSPEAAIERAMLASFASWVGGLPTPRRSFVVRSRRAPPKPEIATSTPPVVTVTR